MCEKSQAQLTEELKKLLTADLKDLPETESDRIIDWPFAIFTEEARKRMWEEWREEHRKSK